MSDGMRFTLVVVLTVLVVGCRDVSLPNPPGAGSLRASVLTAAVDRTELIPAVGATVQLLGTSLQTTVDSDGNFVLSNITAKTGRVLIALDVDRDGTPERSRVITLESVKAGYGHPDVNAGQLILGRNATIVGSAKRGDRAQLPSGHTGITVFLPQLPQVAFTGDDGSFVLGGIPEGDAIVSFFAPGYRGEATNVTVSSGAELRLSTVVLTADPGAPSVGQLSGVITLADATPVAAVDVQVAGAGTTANTSTSADGRFTFATLPTGTYSLAFRKSGLRSLRIDGVLLGAAVKEVGPYVMTPGDSTTITLDAGTVPTGDAGTSTDAGVPDGGMTDAGSSDAGVPDGGALVDAGSIDGGGGDAGFTTADAGSAPVAIVGRSQLVRAGIAVQLDGQASTGAHPLSYEWAQVAGPTVALSPSTASPTSHSPTFTAPIAGSVLEFSLTVIDRFGVRSTNSAIARVSVGTAPTARFTPDSGLSFGGQRLVLQSTSVDDGGLVLINYDWRLVSGADAGVLITDGGPTALFTLPAVAFAAPDVLTAVELRVTNSIGAVSNAAQQFYTVRGTTTGNWSLDAGPQQSVLVTTSTPTVALNASFNTAIPSAQVTYAWACSPTMPLIGPDTATPRFLAPVVVGTNAVVTCVVTATAAPPLDPPVLTGSVNVILRDGIAPTVLTHNIEPMRMGRFGFFVRANEPLSDANISAMCSAGGLFTDIRRRVALAGPSYAELSPGTTCSNMTVTMTDRAGNTSTAQPFGPATAVTISDQWSGPYESTMAFDDPRPVIAALGNAPVEQQLENGAATTTPGFEVLVANGSTLARLSAIDLSANPTCSPTCPVSATTLGVPTRAGSDVGPRSFFAGAELLVVTDSDGGLAPTVARRNAAGSWSTFTGLTGAPGQWGTTLRTARVDATGLLSIDTFDPQASTFTMTDQVATGQTQALLAGLIDNYAVVVGGPMRTLTARRKNPMTQLWTNVNVASAPTQITGLQMVSSFYPPDSIPSVLLAHAGGLSLLRLDFPNTRPVETVPVTGFDAVGAVSMTVVAYASNGDIRLKQISPGVWAGGSGISEFFSPQLGGPPRTGFTPPYPLVLDNSIACEAAYPRLAFIEGALVVVWQERCSPTQQWKVYARVLR